MREIFEKEQGQPAVTNYGVEEFYNPLYISWLEQRTIGRLSSVLDTVKIMSSTGIVSIETIKAELASKITTEIVSSFNRKDKRGFTGKEIETLLDNNGIDKNKFYEILGVHTCIKSAETGESLTFVSDIESTLYYVLSDTQPHYLAWD